MVFKNVISYLYCVDAIPTLIFCSLLCAKYKKANNHFKNVQINFEKGEVVNSGQFIPESAMCN